MSNSIACFIYHRVVFWKLGIVTVKHLRNCTLTDSCITYNTDTHTHTHMHFVTWAYNAGQCIIMRTCTAIRPNNASLYKLSQVKSSPFLHLLYSVYLICTRISSDLQNTGNQINLHVPTIIHLARNVVGIFGTI